MASENEIKNKLTIKLNFNTDAWNRQVNGAANELNQLNRRINTVDRSTQKTTKSFISFGDALQFITVTNALPYLKNTALELDRVENRMKFATNSTDDFNKAMKLTEDTANKLGLALVETQRGFSTIAASAKGTSLEGQPVVELFNAVSNASAALSLTADETNSVFLAFSQIISKGKVAAEELRGQIGERLPGAFNAAARSLGVTNQELDKMLQDGTVIAEDFLPKFATELNRVFGEQALKNAGSLTAQFNRISNALKVIVEDIAKMELSQQIINGYEKLAEGIQARNEIEDSDNSSREKFEERYRRKLVNTTSELIKQGKSTTEIKRELRDISDLFIKLSRVQNIGAPINKLRELSGQQTRTDPSDPYKVLKNELFEGVLKDANELVVVNSELFKENLKLIQSTKAYNDALVEQADDSALVTEELGKLRALRAENEQSFKNFKDREAANDLVDSYNTQLSLQEKTKKTFEQQTAELRAQKKQIEDNIRAQSGINFIEAITKGSGRDIKLDIQASAIERQGGLIADDILQEQLSLLGEINDKLTTLEQIQEVN